MNRWLLKCLNLIGIDEAKNILKDSIEEEIEFKNNKHMIWHLSLERLDTFRPYSMSEWLQLCDRNEKRRKMLCFAATEAAARSHSRYCEFYNQLTEPEHPTYLYGHEISAQTLMLKPPYGKLRSYDKLYFVYLAIVKMLGVKYAVDQPQNAESTYGSVISPLEPHKLPLIRKPCKAAVNPRDFRYSIIDEGGS